MASPLLQETISASYKSAPCLSEQIMPQNTACRTTVHAFSLEFISFILIW